MEKVCYIFAAGDFTGSIKNNANDIIIAADAGFHHLEKIGLTPDILLGDFDTIGAIPESIKIVEFPKEKDYTDTELAIIYGIENGFKKFVICGALGGKRLEHTLGNLSIAASYAERGYDVTLTDGDYKVIAVHNSSYVFTGDESGFVSLFTISGKARSVSIDGLKYTLNDAVLDSSNPTLCISNEFIGKKATVSVEDGTVLIMWQNGK